MNDHKMHKMSQEKLNKAYKLFFGTLTSKIRLDIINLLRKGQRTVSELQKELKLEQSIVSHNLRRMQRCGFVDVQKKGKFRVYSLNTHTIKPLMQIIDKHMSEHCMKIISKEKKQHYEKVF